MKGMDRGRSVASGRSYPLGAHRVDGGTNFSVWSRTAAALDLLLFDHVDDPQPSRVMRLDPRGTGPSPTGMCSCPTWTRASSMRGGSTGCTTRRRAAARRVGAAA